MENRVPNNVVITLAKPQYNAPNFGYFKVDFKAPKHLPKIHFIETREVKIETDTSVTNPVGSFCQVFKNINNSAAWNTACLIRRAVKTFNEDEPRPASLGPCFRRQDNFIDIATNYIPFDLDAIPVVQTKELTTPDALFAEIDAFINKYLPKCFHNVNYVCQLTPSFRPDHHTSHEAEKSRVFEKRKLHVRLYFLLSKPLYTAQLSAYPWSDLDDEDKLSIGLEPGKAHLCIDKSIYRQCQPIYIANPLFIEQKDPLADYPQLSRWMFTSHHKEFAAYFDVLDIPAENAAGQRNEIRSIMYMGGVEGAYSRQAQWADLLSQFGYSQSQGFGEEDRWISPHSTSSSAGVVINRDGRIWSHHSPEHCMIAKTGRALTPFDFMREFVFDGNYRAALAYAMPFARKDKQYQREQEEISNTTINAIMDFIDIPQTRHEHAVVEYDALMTLDNAYRIIMEEVIRGSFYDHLRIDKVIRVIANKLGHDPASVKNIYNELKLIGKHLYDDVAKIEAKSGRLDFLLDGVSDETNALALINAYGGKDSLLAYDDRVIYAYDSKFWNEFPSLTAQKAIISKYSIDNSHRTISLDDAKKTAITRSLHTEVLRNTQRRFGYEDCFSLKKNIVALRNCVIDISNWNRPKDPNGHKPIIRAYQPDDHVVYPLNFKYEGGAKCPQFINFLNTIYPGHPELVELQQMKFGYILTTGNVFQKIFMQKGERRSGKGTLDRMMKEMVPKGYFEPTTFEKLSGRFGQTVFRRAKVVNIPDYKKGTLTGKSRNMVEEVIISSSGGDTIAIEEKHARQEGIKPVAVLTVSSNEIIDITNIDAFFSRLIVIPHMVSFEGREDFELEEKLYKELPGILNWAIEGAYKLGAQGRFIEPPICIETKNDMIEVNSPMSAFVRQYYYVDKTVSPSLCTTKDGFRNSYKAWLSRPESSIPPETIIDMCDENTMNATIRVIIGQLETKYRRQPKRMNGKLVQAQYGLIVKPEYREIAAKARNRVKNADDKMKYCLDTDDISILWDEKYRDHEFGPGD